MLFGGWQHPRLGQQAPCWGGNRRAGTVATCGLLTALPGLLTAIQGLLTALCGLLAALRRLLMAMQGLLIALCGLLTALCGLLTVLRGLLITIQGLLTALRGLLMAIQGLPRAAGSAQQLKPTRERRPVPRHFPPTTGLSGLGERVWPRASPWGRNTCEHGGCRREEPRFGGNKPEHAGASAAAAARPCPVPPRRQKPPRLAQPLACSVLIFPRPRREV